MAGHDNPQWPRPTSSAPSRATSRPRTDFADCSRPGARTASKMLAAIRTEDGSPAVEPSLGGALRSVTSDFSASSTACPQVELSFGTTVPLTLDELVGR